MPGARPPEEDRRRLGRFTDAWRAGYQLRERQRVRSGELPWMNIDRCTA
jgi:hypothetical protein